MTREELKEHCEKQIEMCEMWAISKGKKPSGNIYEEHKLILELLEQEPCEDAVKREDAKKFLYERLDRLNDDELYDIFSTIIDDMYNELPSVTLKTRWIPISERLPEIQQVVLLSLRSLNVEVGFRAKTEPYFYCHNAGSCYIEPQNVLAWQPLPKPYKKESD